VPTPSRASAWVLASSFLLTAHGAVAQRQDQPERGDAAAPPGSRDTRLESRRGGMGRDQFIAPVMGIQIEGEGLNLPPEAAEEPPPKPAATPATTTPAETKSEEPRSTGR